MPSSAHSIEGGRSGSGKAGSLFAKEQVQRLREWRRMEESEIRTEEPVQHDKLQRTKDSVAADIKRLKEDIGHGSRSTLTDGNFALLLKRKYSYTS
ncbi:hypothetical protein VNI00_012130 [Paramarasmius palmivorus]|uniref:Uncharacterized protein n=1 Tax=Paramarasmius palmivorus TaxID=297713 RepID=A0AAW0C6K6_9AGAR